MRFLLFSDPYHKSIYQLDLQNVKREFQGITLESAPNFPKYFDLDVIPSMLYYMDTLAECIKVVNMKTRLDTVFYKAEGNFF